MTDGTAYGHGRFLRELGSRDGACVPSARSPVHQAKCISGHHGKLEVPTHRSEHRAMTFDRVRHPLAPLERSQESEPPRDFVRARGVAILGVESDTIKTWSGYFDFRRFAEQMRCRCARVRRVVVRSRASTQGSNLASCTMYGTWKKSRIAATPPSRIVTSTK